MLTPTDIIGVDLDNTIIDYDALFVTAARDLGLLGPNTVPGDGTVLDKAAVRDALRARPGGEADWQRLQAMVYGPRILEARLMDGVDTFFARCREVGMDVRIISHKTRFAAAAPGGTDLHEAARAFLADRGIDAGKADFAETRTDKVRRIRVSGCTLFIDDLEEVFATPGFPAGVRRVLFDPVCRHAPGHLGSTVCRSWKEIIGHVFGARG